MSDSYELKPDEPPAERKAAPLPSPADMGPLDLAPVIESEIEQKKKAGTVSGAQALSEAGIVDPSVPPPVPGFVPPTPVVTREEDEAAAAAEDVEKHKGVAIVGYVPPLFVVPLLVAPNSAFARYHANQGFLVFIIGFAAVLGAAFLELGSVALYPVMKWVHLDILATLGWCAAHVGAVGLVVGTGLFVVAGIVNAANGEFKPLPLIGRYTLIR